MEPVLSKTEGSGGGDSASASSPPPSSSSAAVTEPSSSSSAATQRSSPDVTNGNKANIQQQQPSKTKDAGSAVVQNMKSKPSATSATDQNASSASSSSPLPPPPRLPTTATASTENNNGAAGVGGEKASSSEAPVVGTPPIKASSPASASEGKASEKAERLNGQERSPPVDDRLPKLPLPPSSNSGGGGGGVRKCSVKLVDIGGSSPSSEPTAANSGSGMKRDLASDNGSGGVPGDVGSIPAKKVRETVEAAGAEFPASSKLSITPSSRDVSSPRVSSPLSKAAKWSLAGSNDPSSPSPSKQADKSFKFLSSGDGGGGGGSPRRDGPTGPGGKVTISPVRQKEKTGGGGGSAGGTGSGGNSGGPAGSVTITKLSTGTTQCVDSRDLKSLLSGGGGGGHAAQSDGGSKAGITSNGVRMPSSSPSDGSSSSSNSKKSSHSYSVEVAAKKQKKLQQQQQQQQFGGGGGVDGSDINCNKCKQAFSTKEAMRLHTCNSILDSQYLTDSADRDRKSASSATASNSVGASSSSSTGGDKSSTTSPVSSLSRGSSRSNSPLLSQASKQQQQQQQAAAKSDHQQESKVAPDGFDGAGGSATTAAPVQCKLIKDERDNKLMIEGRPKLSISKVSPKAPQPKVKSPGAAAAGEDAAAATGLKRKNSDSVKDIPKIRIKLPTPATEGAGGSAKTGVGGGKPAMGVKKPAEDDGPYTFTFAGKPTYSPSRVEPSQTIQEKESPRDASNKDSPASQSSVADSGVFSIQSNSPSKGDGTTSGTSPDSPNARYPDQHSFNHQQGGNGVQWKHQGQQSQNSGPSSSAGTATGTGPPSSAAANSSTAPHKTTFNTSSAQSQSASATSSSLPTSSASASSSFAAPPSSVPPSSSSSGSALASGAAPPPQSQTGGNPGAMPPNNSLSGGMPAGSNMNHHQMMQQRQQQQLHQKQQLPPHQQQMGPMYGGGGPPPPGSRDMSPAQQQYHHHQQQMYQQMQAAKMAAARQQQQQQQAASGLAGGQPGGGPAAAAAAAAAAAHQQQQQSGAAAAAAMARPHYPYAAQDFFNYSNPPAKRKRGRPRKNPLSEPRPPKDPNAPKRKYVRKKPPAQQSLPTPGPLGRIGAAGTGAAAVSGTGSAASAADSKPSSGGGGGGGSSSVYNFDEDDNLDDPPGGLQSMRPKRASSAGQKKYSFGSSSDEDNMPKGQQRGIAGGHFGGGPGGYPQPGTYQFQQFQQQQQQRQRMMQQQQHQAGYMQQQQMQQQHMQQQHQQQQHGNQANNRLPSEENTSYSSEVLKTGGVGIKIKIKKQTGGSDTDKQKKEPDMPNNNAMPGQPQPQQQQQQQNSMRPMQHQQQQQQQPNAMMRMQNMQQHQQMQQPHMMRQRQMQQDGMNQQRQQQQQQHPMGQQQNQQQFGNPGSVDSTHSPAPYSHNSPGALRSPYNHVNSPQTPMQQQQQQQQQSNHQQSQQAGPNGGAQHMQQQMQTQQQQQQQHQMQQQQQMGNFGGPNANPMMRQQQMMCQFPNSGGMYGSNYRMGSPYGHQDGGGWNGSGGAFTPGAGGMFPGQHPQNRFMGPQAGAYGNQFSHHPQANNQFMQQQHNSQFGGGGGNGDPYGGNGMYGNANGGHMQQQSDQFGGGFNNPIGMAQQRMMGPGGMGPGGDMSSQPVPPNFRGAPGMTSPMGNGGGGMVNSPRISPSAMHMPMPGVGMPRVSPATNAPGNHAMNPRQATPLVSPQSDHSPASHNPLTPASNHGGPLTPQQQHQQQQQQPYGGPGSNGGMHHPGQVSPMMGNPRTPQSVGSYSMHQQRSVEMAKPLPSPMGMGMQQQQQQQQQQHMNDEMMRSPMAGGMISPNSNTASNLRKIRRPSKPNQQDVTMASPAHDFKTEVKDEPKPEPKSPPAPPPPPQAIKAESPKPPTPRPATPEPVFEARWEELPAKALKRILQFGVANEGAVPFLVRASRVSKAWHEVTKDLSIWTHLDLSSGRLKEKYRNDKKLEEFLKRYPNVKEVKLTGWKNSVSTTTLKMLSTVCPDLLSLGLASCFKLTNDDLKFIGENFHKLERIDLSNVSSSSCSSRSVVSSSCLSEFISTVGDRLTYLNISNNKMAGLPFVFKAISSNSANLEELDISNITTTSRDTILIHIEKFQKGCRKLRVLNANHTMISLQETPIKEQIQAPGFPQLREIHVAVDSRGYFEGMDDGQIERLLKKSDKLRMLDIRGCVQVSDSCLIRLPTWDVEKLVLAGSSAASSSMDGLSLMVRKWASHLVEVDFSSTTGERIIDNAIEAFAEEDNVIIRKVNLCNTSVSLKPLTRLLKNCPTLEYLNLTGCRGLPRGMKRLYSEREKIVTLRDEIVGGKYNQDDSDD